MEEVKIIVEKIRGIAVSVQLAGDLQEYQSSFLAIFNNVRENEELLHMKNYSSSDTVTVYCMAEYEQETIDWLSHFGTVNHVEECDIFIPSEDYTNDEMQVYAPYVF